MNLRKPEEKLAGRMININMNVLKYRAGNASAGPMRCHIFKISDENVNFKKNRDFDEKV